jgi:hypothetical protein
MAINSAADCPRIVALLQPGFRKTMVKVVERQQQQASVFSIDRRYAAGRPNIAMIANEEKINRRNRRLA